MMRLQATNAAGGIGLAPRQIVTDAELRARGVDVERYIKAGILLVLGDPTKVAYTDPHVVPLEAEEELEPIEVEILEESSEEDDEQPRKGRRAKLGVHAE